MTPIYEKDRRSDQAKKFLRNSHWARAGAYEQLQKLTEAIRDRDKAIDLSPKAEQAGFRVTRISTRIAAGLVDEAVAEVTAPTESTKWNDEYLYNFACSCAIASEKSVDKKQQYADQAMDLLRKAVKAGWNDAAHMAKDTDLDPLRGRDDFKQLIESLTKKLPAKFH